MLPNCPNFCCDSLWKSIFMAVEKPGKLKFFSPTLWPPCIWYGGRLRPRLHCVRWDPAPKNGHSSTLILGRCLLWLNGWMDHDATWYRGRPRPGRRCVRWGPSSPKGHTPNFRPMSVVAKRLDGSRCHLVRR